MKPTGISPPVIRILIFILLFLVGFYLYFLSGNIIITILGCLLLGLIVELRTLESAFGIGAREDEPLLIVDGRHLTWVLPSLGLEKQSPHICPVCGSEIGGTSKFCSNCGQKLSPCHG